MVVRYFRLSRGYDRCNNGKSEKHTHHTAALQSSSCWMPFSNCCRLQIISLVLVDCSHRKRTQARLNDHVSVQRPFLSFGLVSRISIVRLSAPAL